MSKSQILLSHALFSNKSKALVLSLLLASLDLSNATSTVQQQQMLLSCSPEKGRINPLLEYPTLQNLPLNAAHWHRDSEYSNKDQQDQMLCPAGGSGQVGPFPSSLPKWASAIFATDSTLSLQSSSSKATPTSISLRSSPGGDAAEAGAGAGPVTVSTDDAGPAPSKDVSPALSSMLRVGPSANGDTASSEPPGQQPSAGGPSPAKTKCVNSCPQHCFNTSNEDTLQTFLNRLGNMETALTQTNIKLTQTTHELNQTNIKLTQTNTKLTQTNTELTQTKTELTQTKTELTQTNARVSNLEKEMFGLCRVHARVDFGQIIQRFLGRQDRVACASHIFEKAYNCPATNHLVTSFLVDGLSITDTSAHRHTVQLIDQGLTYRNELALPPPSHFTQQVIIDNLKKNVDMLDEVEKVRENPALELMRGRPRFDTVSLQLILSVLERQAKIATLTRLPLKPWVVQP